MPPLDLRHPRDLRAILAAAAGLYRRHFLVFVVPALLAVGLVDLASVALDPGLLVTVDEGDPALAGIVAFGIGVPLIAVPFVTAMHVRAVQDVGAGRIPTLRRVVAAIPAVILPVAAVVLITTVGTAVGFVLLVIPGVFLSVKLFVAAQAAAVEPERGVRHALRTSWDLVEGTWWRVFGISLALFLLAAIGAGILSIPLDLLAEDLDSSTVALISLVAADTLLVSFTALAGTLLYFDLLARERAADATA